jgi:xylan 1,4-beta-xylosidase
MSIKAIKMHRYETTFKCGFFIVIFLTINPGISNAQNTDTTVSLKVDLSAETGPMIPAWAWFGYDEPNYTYMKDGKKLLSEL